MWYRTRSEIRADGKLEGVTSQRKKRASMPGKPGIQKIERFGTTLSSEPVLVVGQIEELRGQRAHQGGKAKSEHGGENGRTDEESEKCRLGLPAIRSTAAVEVRLHDIRLTRVQRCKMNDRQEHK